MVHLYEVLSVPDWGLCGADPVVSITTVVAAYEGVLVRGTTS